MNRKEFEDYLQSIGGLVNGYRPDRPPIVSNLCSVGDGWLELIKDCIQELIDAGWGKHVYQIKEKFGGLRFYIGDSNDEQDEIITKYERLSYKTCEECGKEGKPRKGSWIKTLCDEHAEDKK